MRGPLRQAEILRDLVEPRVVSGTTGQIQFVPVEHPLSIVMSQDCDLEQDFFLRFPLDGEPRPPEEVDRQPNALRAVLLCDAHEMTDMEAHFRQVGSKERDLVKKNQNERYHCLAEGSTPAGATAPSLMLDLRTPFAVPAALLYEQLFDGEAAASRLGVIPDVHSHDLMHRFYTYQARVALPPVPSGQAGPQALLPGPPV